jgi:hypothetical protein
MRPPIQVNSAVGVRPTDVENVDTLHLGKFNKLDPVRREKLSYPAGRLAPRVRFQLVDSSISEQRPRPWLQGH